MSLLLDFCAEGIVTHKSLGSFVLHILLAFNVLTSSFPAC